MPVNCCVYGCTTNSKKNRGLTFHGFPKNPDVRKVWIVKLRQGKVVSSHMKVCSLHFNESDFATPRAPEGITRNRFLKEGSFPSVNLPRASFTKSVIDNGRSGRAAARNTNKGANESNVAQSMAEVDPPVTLNAVSSALSELDEGPSQSGPSSASSSPSASESIPSSAGAASNITACSHNLKKRTSLFSVCIMNKKQLVHFTGFTRVQFEGLWKFVSGRAGFKPCQQCVVNSRDQLLLTLMKMRLNMAYSTLAFSFGISEHFARTIFNHWVQSMYLSFKEVDFWSLYQKAEGEYDLIIDCTEVQVQQSSDPATNQALYSTYKSNHTLKALVGVSESGAVLYCSQLFGGSVSDRQIVLLSGFLDKVKSGQFIMADKGFLISDLLEEKGATLNIPPVRRSRHEQMSELDVAMTRAVANRRIVVEQIIGKAKNYAILTDTVPTHLFPLMDEILYVVFHFANFKNKAV